MDNQNIIEERNQKIRNLLSGNFIFILILIALVIFGVYIRMLPLTSHNGTPGLWDYTTNDYTLGPDLDPFLFLRHAKEIINSSFNKVDSMRSVPLGFDNARELQMVSYSIVGTYYLINLFGSYSINYAGALMPVLAFGLTIIVFFFFVRELFIRKYKKINSNIIALISTLFLIVIPEFLSRTIAGIPEKESLAFLFMFMSFYFFIKAWKSETLSKASIFGLLAGLATTLMGLTWSGVVYVYVTIGVTTLIAFLLNKVHKKEILIYSIWITTFNILLFFLSNRFPTLKEYILGSVINIPYAGLATLTLGILIMHSILWNTKIKDFGIWNKINIPKQFISIIITIVLGIVILLIKDPLYFRGLYQTLVHPVNGRWSTTVAENRQPYFSEWQNSFGLIFFWGFILGSIELFKKTFSILEKKKAWVLSFLYCFFLFGLIFSRYSSLSLFNGLNFISIFLYFGSSLLLLGFVIYYYIEDYRKKEYKFQTIEFEYLFLLLLLVLCLFTARSAVRLIMVLVPVATIFLSFLIVEMFNNFRKQDKNKIIILIIGLTIVCLSAYTCFTFYEEIKVRAYNYVPYYYTLQWQEAMSWVRDNTSTNSVFVHWWDYGYWVQSIGERATVVDGGNSIVWWNYLVGRLILTGNNQGDALDFLYSHNATHLLIDSSDIGKYGAFSQIGSDKNYDRFSQGPITFISNPSFMQETKNGIIKNYNMPSGNGYTLIPVEEDVIFNNTILFSQKTALVGITTEYLNNDSFTQPQAIFYSNGLQVGIPMRYLYYNNIFIDYGYGINATAYITQMIYNNGQGLQIDNTGSAIYISPRVMKGMLAQIYLLDDPLNNWDSLKLVHSEPDYILEQISLQGVNLNEFVYYNGLHGPIKIWEINYTGNEKINEEYLRTDIPDYITWKF